MAVPWSLRRRTVMLTLVVLAPALLALFYFAGKPGLGGPGLGDSAGPRLISGSPAPVESATTPTPPAPVSTLRATEPPVKSAQPKPPPQGTGVFRTAPGGTAVIGTAGTLRKYCVQVEEGTGFTPAGFAAAVDTVLANERSWIASNKVLFQRMPSCSGVKFTIRLAFPKTVDRLCTSADTAGKYSCWSGYHVLINLDRWKYAVPHFNGDLVTYRKYVVNHEVGHALGNQHEPCSGSGNLAPVMQTQTIAFNGCVANGWPYDEDGNRIK